MGYEDFTTYTEVDPNSHITVGTYQIIHEIYEDETAYVYDDKGAGNIGDYTMICDAKSVVDSNSTMGLFWMTSNYVSERKYLIDNDYDFVAVKFQVIGTGARRIYVEECDAGFMFYDYYEGYSSDTMYYFMIKKTGTAFRVGVYSTDALRDAGDATDGDVDNLLLTLHSDYTFRYMFASTLRNWGGANHMTLYSEKLDMDYTAAVPPPSTGTVPAIMKSTGILAHKPKVGLPFPSWSTKPRFPKFNPRVVI